MPHEPLMWRRAQRDCQARPARLGAAQPIFISQAARRAAATVRVGYAVMVTAFAGSIALILSGHAASGWLLLVMAVTAVFAVRAGAARR